MINWLSIDDAAKYLNLGKTVVYSLTREGKIPASKISNKWLYDRKLLDAWVKSKRPVEDFFMKTCAEIEENEHLREPQIDAYKAIYRYFNGKQSKAIVQIPVGCGKSGIAAIIPFGISRGRVLIVAPNLTIRDGLHESMDITNFQKCFWRNRKILREDSMLGGPYVSTLDRANYSVCEKSHVVVTNIQQLATNPEKWLEKFPADFFDLVILDEAHHSAAASWKKVTAHFREAKILYMTATPFRSDGQEIEGELVYRYPFKKATFNGYIKNIKAWYVAPSELTFTAYGQTQTYTLDEVLRLKDREWFSRGIALSEACNISIVDNSLEKLEQLRKTGTNHQLIAVACSVMHAQQIRALYASRGFSAEVIHSQLDDEQKESVMRRLKSGELDCIVQVQMLGEGFDHPKLSVAAIFRPFRSLAPYIQFVGRILRVVVQNDARHPDNYGHIVTHAGMNLDERLREFKLFEKDDNSFWEGIIRGNEPPVPREISSGESRMRFRELAVADSEIADSLIEENFTSADEEDLIAELSERMEQLGLDSSLAKTLVMSKDPSANLKEAAKPFSVQPQTQWQESRRRLQEDVRHAAKMLLNRLQLRREGRELMSLGVPGKGNFVAAITLINQEIKVMFKDSRDDWEFETFKTAQSELDNILNNLTRKFKKKLDE